VVELAGAVREDKLGRVLLVARYRGYAEILSRHNPQLARVWRDERGNAALNRGGPDAASARHRDGGSPKSAPRYRSPFLIVVRDQKLARRAEATGSTGGASSRSSTPFQVASVAAISSASGLSPASPGR
jgi:hypothetical protein